MRHHKELWKWKFNLIFSLRPRRVYSSIHTVDSDTIHRGFISRQQTGNFSVCIKKLWTIYWLCDIPWIAFPFRKYYFETLNISSQFNSLFLDWSGSNQNKMKIMHSDISLYSMFLLYFQQNWANIYLFKDNNGDIRKRCEICSKLTIKTQERRQWLGPGFFIINFEHFTHL